jgi:hypothetical protein
MDGVVEPGTSVTEPNRVLELVNQARATYDASELKRLLPGQVQSASFCPIGRSLRAGVEDWLFTAVGTKFLRVWALGNDPATIGKQILTAWEMPHSRLKQSGERSGYVLVPLPPELRLFVYEFDRGILRDYQGRLDPEEVRRLRELARGMPIPGRQRKLSWGNIHGDGALQRLPQGGAILPPA